MSVYDAVVISQEIHYGPTRDKAEAICQGRGVNPYDTAAVHGYWLERWRAVIVEALLMADIREEILAG